MPSHSCRHQRGKGEGGTFIQTCKKEESMEDLLKTLADAILAGEKPVAEKIVRQAIEAGIQPEKILKEGLTPAMDEVGRRFECGEAFIPEMLIAARSMQAALAILKPYLVDTGVQPSGKVVIGTVKGDLHDIGK